MTVRPASAIVPDQPTTSPEQILAPVVDDLSAWIISGAVTSRPGQFRYETDGRTPAQGIQDGVDAEVLGFRRVWLSERWNIKLADVILAGVAARTTRLGVGTGAVIPTTRQPWAAAALGATMQAAFGDRFILGLGRGESDTLRAMGIGSATLRDLSDYIDIYRRLWAGEEVSYHGPAGRLDRFRFTETCHGRPPEIWFAGMARSQGAELVARACDGVLLPPMLTPDATRRAVERLRTACERIDRDPATVRICVPVVTAPDLDEVETRSLTAGRLVTYLGLPGYGEALATENGWPTAPIERLRANLETTRRSGSHEHRHALLGVAAQLPETWITESSAVGSVQDCVQTLQEFRAAGADEVAVYGSTPRQNAGLVEAWRTRAGR